MPEPAIGKIIRMEVPYPPFGMGFGIETASGNYILNFYYYGEEVWEDRLIFEGAEYFVGDEIEITGEASRIMLAGVGVFHRIEVKTINKLSP